MDLNEVKNFTTTETKGKEQEHVDRFEKLLENQSAIVEHTQRIAFWVTFWSILSIIGWVIGLIILLSGR